MNRQQILDAVEAPLFCRNAMIACAVLGPIPGTSSSSAIVAELKSTGCAGGTFLA